MAVLRVLTVLCALALASAGEPARVQMRLDGPHSFRFAGIYAVADGRAGTDLRLDAVARRPGAVRGEDFAAGDWLATAGDPSEAWAAGADLVLVLAVPSGLGPQLVATGVGTATRVRLDRGLPPGLRLMPGAPGPGAGAVAGVGAVEWWGAWPADLAALNLLPGGARTLPAPTQPRQWEFLLVHGSVARADPAMIARVRRAVLAGWEWVRGNPLDAVELVQRRSHPGISRSLLLAEADAVLRDMPVKPDGEVDRAWSEAHAAALAASGVAGAWDAGRVWPHLGAGSESSRWAAAAAVAALLLAAAAVALAVRWRIQHRREQEMHTSTFRRARSVQGRLMPGAAEVPGLAVTMHDEPHAALGGDFYFAGMMADGRWAILLGDVSGKDVPAALVATAAAREFKHLVPQHRRLSDLFTALDASLRGHLHEGSFLTAIGLAWDPGLRRIEVQRAGHLPALIDRRGEIGEFGLIGAAIGLTGATWQPQGAAHADLDPGDRVLLLTDGITEAARGPDEFGLARAGAAFAAVRGPGAPQAVLAAARAFAGELTDDATVIVLEVLA